MRTRNTILTMTASFAALAALASSSLAAPKAQTVNLDPKASTIAWTGKKLAGSHNGLIQLKEGKVELRKGALVGGSFVVDMSSITALDVTDPEYNAKLVGHLKADDFFGVDKFPMATFKISKVKALPAAAGQPTHEISGEMTIKGQTHPVTFPASVSVKDGKAEAKATVVLDRTRWGIKYNSGKFLDAKALGDKLIEDNFTLELKLVGQAL
ncbi:MAG: YceI family protein [Oligoflexia bacterium]|nr:YceI family protein [Oligoflexia bacterium]